MSSEPPATSTNPSLPPSELTLPPRADFALLSPSARTSFTRVDVSAGDGVDGGGGGEDSGQAPTEDVADDAEAEGETQQEPTVPQTPQVSLTFLLVSGRRRSMTFEPETTVGRVKELAWNAWPNEWQDERPPAPSYLRILYLGKILQDEDTLIKVGFPTHIPPTTSGTASTAALTAPVPTIVHLSIRACPPAGAKDTPKKLSIRRSSVAEGEEETQGAGCCSGCVVC